MYRVSKYYFPSIPPPFLVRINHHHHQKEEVEVEVLVILQEAVVRVSRFRFGSCMEGREKKSSVPSVPFLLLLLSGCRSWLRLLSKAPQQEEPRHIPAAVGLVIITRDSRTNTEYINV